MSRHPSNRTRRAAAVLGGLLSVAGALAIASPAAAYVDPAELTFAVGNPWAEDLGGVTFAGECVPGSDSAQLRWDIGSGQVQVPVALDGNGEFSGLGPYFTGAAPGLGLAVTLDCLQGATSLGADYEFVSYPDLGASISGGTTLALDAAFAPTFDCGTAVTPSTFSSAWVTLYDPADVQLDQVVGLPVPTGSVATLGTPQSYGLAVGDTVALYLNCFADAGGPSSVAGTRSYAVTITAAPTAPASGGSAGALAETGVEPLPLVALAVLAILIGVGATVRAGRR